MEKKVEKINSLVDDMLKSYQKHEIITNVDAQSQLNKELILDILELLQQLIYPGYFEIRNLKHASIEYHVGEIMENVHYHLAKQVSRVMDDGDGVTERFLEDLPAIRAMLATDVQAAYDGDPAAFNTDEVILSYPGIYAITVNRIAHGLHMLGVPLIPRMMTEHAHSVTGIDIHPGATIGERFFIDHGTGVVIGETTILGNDVKIYQGVTLGALSTRGGQCLRDVKRHPTIEDNVTVYSGASILGGQTIVGRGAVIGSNAFVTSSVPANTRVSIKNPELQLKDGPRSSELGQEGFFNRKEID